MVTTTTLLPHALAFGYSGERMLERARAVGIFEVLRKALQGKDIAECFGRGLCFLKPRKLVRS